jgi:mRNA-degrading endonuclease RelE of RelBE toxin-antitoxin system
MRANVIVTPNFQREAKELMKKYRSLKSELAELAEQLEENPKMGILIGEDTYKIRLAVKSKGKGKSGGMRVITYVEIEVIENEEKTDVYLLSIYDKSKYENISDKVLGGLISEVQSEIEKEKQAKGEEE